MDMEDDDYDPYSWYERDFNPITGSSSLPSRVSGVPGGTSGITGHIPGNLREILRKIYKAFWIREFTCQDIQNKHGLKRLNFKCTQLRTLRNYGAVTFTTKRIERGSKPVRVWKLTSSTINYFTTH